MGIRIVTQETQQSTAPATTHTHRKPIDKPTTTLAHLASTSTGLPNPKSTPVTTGEYRITKGHLWGRAHQQVRKFITFHNRHMMNLMPRSFVQAGQHLLPRQIATDGTASTMNGQQRQKQP